MTSLDDDDFFSVEMTSTRSGEVIHKEVLPRSTSIQSNDSKQSDIGSYSKDSSAGTSDSVPVVNANPTELPAKISQRTSREVMNEKSQPSQNHNPRPVRQRLNRRYKQQGHSSAHSGQKSYEYNQLRLSQKYQELHSLLHGEYGGGIPGPPNWPQVQEAQKFMRKHQLKASGYVGQMHGMRPSSAQRPILLESPLSPHQHRPHSAHRPSSSKSYYTSYAWANSPRDDAATQTPTQGQNDVLIDARLVPGSNRRVNFREGELYPTGTFEHQRSRRQNLLPVKNTKSPTRRKKSPSPEIKHNRNKGRKSSRSVSSETDTDEDTGDEGTSKADSAPIQKPSDYQWKGTDNEKMQAWLKIKRKLARRQRIAERKEKKAKKKEELQEQEQKQERHKESKQKVQEWMKKKRKELRLLRRLERLEKVKKPRDGSASSSESSDSDSSVEEQEETMVSVEVTQVKSESDAPQKEDGQSTANEDDAENTEEEKENLDIQQNEEGSLDDKKPVKTESKKAKRERKSKKVKIKETADAQEHSDKSKVIIPTLDLSGQPVISKKLKRKKKVTKSENKGENKVEMTTEDKRLSYDQWLKSKRLKNQKEKTKAKKEAEKARESLDEDMVNVVSQVAKKRIDNISKQKKNIDLGPPEKDTDKQSASDSVEQDIEVTDEVDAEGTNKNYRWLSSNSSDNTSNKKGTGKGKLRPISSTSKKKTNPRKTKSAPNVSASGDKNKSDEVNNSVPVPPTSQVPPMPKLPKHPGQKKVAYEQKSWEGFAKYVWEKLNDEEEASENERPEPQGSDQPDEHQGQSLCQTAMQTSTPEVTAEKPPLAPKRPASMFDVFGSVGQAQETKVEESPKEESTNSESVFLTQAVTLNEPSVLTEDDLIAAHIAKQEQNQNVTNDVLSDEGSDFDTEITSTDTASDLQKNTAAETEIHDDVAENTTEMTKDDDTESTTNMVKDDVAESTTEMAKDEAADEVGASSGVDVQDSETRGQFLNVEQNGRTQEEPDTADISSVTRSPKDKKQVSFSDITEEITIHEEIVDEEESIPSEYDDDFEGDKDDLNDAIITDDTVTDESKETSNESKDLENLS